MIGLKSHTCEIKRSQTALTVKRLCCRPAEGPLRDAEGQESQLLLTQSGLSSDAVVEERTEPKRSIVLEPRGGNGRRL